MPTPTFWIECTDLVRVSLRRFTFSEHDGLISPDRQNCPASGHGHDASQQLLAEAPAREFIDVDKQGHYSVLNMTRDNPSWPKVCERCGLPFNDDAIWQTNADPLYRGAPDGQLYTLRSAPIGAMWDATWFDKAPYYTGPDGIALVVRLPNHHDWMIDARASNCTMPDDNVHKCWIRHGDPRTQPVTVDKNGVTCAAGAGSILAGDYHGFLQNGILT